MTVHLTLLDADARPWPAFGGPENAFRLSFKHVEEFAVAERPSDGLGSAQPRNHLGIGLFGQEIRKIRVAAREPVPAS